MKKRRRGLRRLEFFGENVAHPDLKLAKDDFQFRKRQMMFASFEAVKRSM